MDRKTVLAAAGALVLTVVGGISALAVAFGGPPVDAGSSPSLDATESPIVVTEYVDEFGNPVAAPGSVATQAGQATFSFDEQPMFQDPSPTRPTLPTTEGTVSAFADPGTVSAGSTDTYSGSDDQYEGSDDGAGGGDHHGEDDEYEGGDD